MRIKDSYHCKIFTHCKVTIGLIKWTLRLHCDSTWKIEMCVIISGGFLQTGHNYFL